MVAEESKAAAAMDVLDAQRNSIWKMLQQQLHARSVAPTILHAAAVAEKTAAAGNVRGEQVAIHKAAVELVKSIAGGDKERLAVKRAMNKLAFGDMLDAVERCDAPAAADRRRRLPPAGRRLDRRAGPDRRLAAEAAGRDAAGRGRGGGRIEEAAEQRVSRRHAQQARRSPQEARRVPPPCRRSSSRRRRTSRRSRSRTSPRRRRS